MDFPSHSTSPPFLHNGIGHAAIPSTHRDTPVDIGVGRTHLALPGVPVRVLCGLVTNGDIAVHSIYSDLQRRPERALAAPNFLQRGSDTFVQTKPGPPDSPHGHKSYMSSSAS